MEKFVKWFDSELAAVEEKISQELSVTPEAAAPASRHVAASGGKRIRALLTLASGKITGGSTEQHVDLAAAVEILHAATLLHDDVIDEAKLRRNKPSVHVLWGNRTAILLGDLLLAKSLKLITQFDSLAVLGTFTRAMDEIIGGEFLQYSQQGNHEITLEQYLEIAGGKTAALFAAAAYSAGLLARAPKEQIDALYIYGFNLGMIFQMVDDLLDYEADETTLGKPVGSDLKEGRVTLPLILAYRAADAADKKRLAAIVAKSFKTATAPKGIPLKRIMHKYGAMEACREVIGDYADRARQALKTFMERETVEGFHELLDFCLIRRR